MASCGLLNLGSCLPQKFFEFVINILNAPISSLLNLTLNLLSERINLSLFSYMWVIVVYILSMFYALLLIGTGFNFIISGYDSNKRENAKTWLRNIVIMIILIQSSYFIYQLAIDLSSILTSTTLTLINRDFFLLTTGGMSDIGMALLFTLLYLIALIITVIILTIRYAFVAVGVVLFPIAIFFYFFSPLKSYGSLIFNFLGISIFVTFFDAILLAGFSKLAVLNVFGNLKIIVLISAFIFISIIMIFLLLFSVIKAALNVYLGAKKLGITS